MAVLKFSYEGKLVMMWMNHLTLKGDDDEKPDKENGKREERGRGRKRGRLTDIVVCQVK